MIKILIVDDHAIVRAGLRQFLVGEEDMVVAGEADDGADAVRWVREESLDVVLLDISMPGLNGLDALRQIKAIQPSLPVLMISAYADSQYALQLIKNGADGYINKEVAPDVLIKAIRMVANGMRYVSPEITQLLLNQVQRPVAADNPHEELSEREFQVLYRLAKGDPLTTIASELCLSVKTISTYRSRLFEKMKFSCNADVTYYALKNGIIK